MHLLVAHGMARTSLSLASLARYLRRNGHQVTLTGYVAALERFDAVSRRVRGQLEHLAADGEPYALIGHSLGGLILRVALDAGPLSPEPRRLIMLGTPNQPPRLVQRFRHLWPYRIVTGQAGQLLSDPTFFAKLPPIRVPYTIIAGMGGTRGRWSLFGEDENDGTVAVAETLCSPNDHPILVSARHTFMMNHADVRRAIVDALADCAAVR
jgi:hypothetical protein